MSKQSSGRVILVELSSEDYRDFNWYSTFKIHDSNVVFYLDHLL